MDPSSSSPATRITQHFNFTSNFGKLFLLVVGVSLVGGLLTGFGLTSSGGKTSPAAILDKAPDHPSDDTKTFKDFAEGTVQKRTPPKNPNEYVEGTHMLIREGAVPVALTSSVVDLSEYEGKKVKVFGETQKAIKEGWLMDVGKVEVQQ